MLLHLGIDDTDSRLGGCTTYVAYRVIKKIVGNNATVLDYPRLVRLNPNVPWKTRGNGAVGITVETEEPDRLIDLVGAEVNRAAESYGSLPAFVVLTESQRKKLGPLFEQAIHRIIQIDIVDKILEEKCFLYAFYKRKHGLVGSMAAASNLLDHGDHTFEVLVYRRPENLGDARFIDPESVKEMDAKYSRYTFNNIDDERILIAPHGKDPVLFGIRGEEPLKLLEAAKAIRSETPEGGLVYKTNQGTDAHYKEYGELREVCLGDSVKLRLRVSEKPATTLGGHVFLKLTDDTHSIKAAFYWETGELRKVASALVPGDQVTIYGGIKFALEPIINTEKLEVNTLRRIYAEKNPICPKCLCPGESAGRNQGYRCRKCKTPLGQAKTLVPVNRPVLPGLYMPPLRYFRHLMKPLKRYGKEKQGYSFSQRAFNLIF